MPIVTATADAKSTLGNPMVVTQVFDGSVSTLAQNDVATLINIPANTYVMKVFWEVETAEGAARNFALGDGADTDGYVTTTTANTLAAGSSDLALTEGAPNTVTGYSNGKFYSAADTLDLLAVTSGGLTTCKIRVSALMVCFG